jgi:CRP-like cAMP-binding protein
VIPSFGSGIGAAARTMVPGTNASRRNGASVKRLPTDCPQSGDACKRGMHCAILRHFPDHTAFSTAAVQHYKRGATVFWEAEHRDDFILVLTGCVKLLRRLENGREVIFHIARPGEPIGEAALFDQLPYAYSAIAHEDSYLVTVPGKQYRAYMATHPHLMTEILKDYALRERTLSDWMLQHAAVRAEVRLAHCFLTLAREFSDHDDPEQIEIRFSRQDIADMIGISLETTIRILSRWESEGVVGKRNGGFHANKTVLREITASD